MPKQIFNSRGIVPLALLLLCIQGGVIAAGAAVKAPNATSVVAATYGLELLTGLVTYAACCWCAWNCVRRLRLNWILVCTSLILWITGIALSAWADLVAHVSKSVAFASDFAFFIYGVPMLLAISMPDEDQRRWWLAGIDGIQALLAGCLVYIQLFSRIPFFGEGAPTSVSLLLRTYNGENILLAIAASIRLLSSPRRSEERFLYRSLTIFLWAYAGSVAVYNYMDTRSPNLVGYYNLLMELPFLVLTLVVLLWGEHRKAEASVIYKTRLTLFIETISPLFFTLALMALGASILRRHFHAGMASIEIALVLYAVRASFLQNRYMQSERELAEVRDRLQKLSFQDALTGVANRRHFDEILEMEWSRAGRVLQPLSLIMLDVDYFKKLNDRYGHPVGDDCLIRIADVLKDCLPRSGDMLARYGGEEFAVILPTTDRAGAEYVAVRMQDAVRELKIKNDPAFSPQVTISAGIATYYPPAPLKLEDLVEAADRALYQAKENGRNRVEFCEICGESVTASQPLPAHAATDTAGTGRPVPAPDRES